MARFITTNKGKFHATEVAGYEEVQYGVRIHLKSGTQVYHNCKPSEVPAYVAGLDELLHFNNITIGKPRQEELAGDRPTY